MSARVAPRWSSDGRAIAYLAPGERGSTLWLVDPDGRNARPTRVSGVLPFDWYLDSRRVIYTRNGEDGRIELVAASLDTGKERLLLKANATEPSVAPDGRSVAYNSADGHFSMNRYVLTLVRPTGATELPRATGEPRQLTFGKGTVARSRRRLVPRQPVDGVHEGPRSRQSQHHREVPLNAPVGPSESRPNDRS